jgi:hypothetical protein
MQQCWQHAMQHASRHSRCVDSLLGLGGGGQIMYSLSRLFGGGGDGGDRGDRGYRGLMQWCWQHVMQHAWEHSRCVCTRGGGCICVKEEGGQGKRVVWMPDAAVMAACDAARLEAQQVCGYVCVCVRGGGCIGSLGAWGEGWGEDGSVWGHT